jgi:hypothetical protein
MIETKIMNEDPIVIQQVISIFFLKKDSKMSQFY